LDELARSRREAAGLRARVIELEKALRDGRGEEGLDGLRERNRDLQEKIERVGRKAREILKKLDVVGEE
jgi:BMFP domain-containing protein YqiC